jgi:hypothetical protein
MWATLSTTLEIAGLELEVELDVSGEYVDEGIGAYEYWGARGVHHDWGWEDIQLSNVFFEPGDIKTALRRYQPGLSGRRFLKAVRRLRRRIDTLLEGTAAKWVADNEEACIDALAAQNDPDDEETCRHRRTQFACAA